MEQNLNLIDRLIAEHDQLVYDVQDLDVTMNDLEAILDLGKASENFGPWWLDRSGQTLQKLRQSLEKVDSELRAHFDHEEGDILMLCEAQKGDSFTSVLHDLSTDHQELKNRFVRLKQDATALAVEELSPRIREFRAYTLRFGVNHTLRLLRAHAESEQEVLKVLKKELESQNKGQ